MPFEIFSTFSLGYLDYQVTGALTVAGVETFQGGYNSYSEAKASIFSNLFFTQDDQFIAVVGNSATTIYNTYKVSDEDAVFIDRTLTTTDTYNKSLRGTTSSTITSTIADIETTWTNVTTNAITTEINYTNTKLSYYMTSPFASLNPVMEFDGEGLVIQPSFGTSWTQDGTKMQYLQIFTETGSFQQYDIYEIKDNDDPITISAEKIGISHNIAFEIDGSPTTVFPQITSLLTYEYTDLQSTTTTFSKKYFYYPPFITSFDDIPTSASFYKRIIKSASLIQTIQDEWAITPEGDEGFSLGLYTSTRVTGIYATGNYYYVDDQPPYFSLLTYRGTIKTTTSQSYVANDQIFGTTYGYNNTAIKFPVTRYLHKNFYTIGIDALGYDGLFWEKYYTQYSPNSNFVVAGTSDKIGGYYWIEPESVLTKLYFTTYAFERGGAVRAPVLAVPINYTSESSFEYGAEYTYQSVSLPYEFYIGSSQASIYWTLSTQDTSSFTTSTQSFTMSYASTQPLLSMGYFGTNDFSNDIYNAVEFSGSIYHTIGIVNTENGASWLQNGFNYWNGTQRQTVGFVDSAISAVGNPEIITFVASEWRAYGFPVATILKTHVNSYKNF